MEAVGTPRKIPSAHLLSALFVNVSTALPSYNRLAIGKRVAASATLVLEVSSSGTSLAVRDLRPVQAANPRRFIRVAASSP